jgi:hypothetical protein
MQWPADPALPNPRANSYERPRRREAISFVRILAA